MLLILGLLIALTTAIILRVGGHGVNAAGLGWMSEQWLTEYRASHPT
jgi:hypothetical protein